MSESNTQTPPPPASSPAPTRAEIVAKVAHLIEERRKERGLTIEKVSQSIKIRIPYLQAIEKGMWEELPGEVYVRGFIIRYAGFLGMDTVALLAPYLAQQSAPPTEQFDSQRRPMSSDVNRLQFLWIGVVGLFVVVFIKLIQKERTAPLKPIAAATAGAPAPTPTPAAATPDAPHTPLPKHVLQIFSPFSLWLRVTASNKTFEGFIPQSSSWTMKGEGNFNVRLGHTKEVILTFDGQRIPLVDDQKSVTLPNEN